MADSSVLLSAVGIPQPSVRRPPAALYIAPVIVAIATLVPLLYLALRAAEADPGVIASLIFRPRTLMLFRNTLALAAGVVTAAVLIALPLAWLTVRTDIRGARLITLLSVLPLAVPGYVMAYALLSLGGNYGVLARLTGLVVPRPSGYWGALAALALYTFPYMFLNIKSALAGLDPGLEESARSLGYSPGEVFVKVVLPLIKPGLAGGSLAVCLYVLGDFGAVALMRYEVFSYAIYTQYSGAFDRVYAAVLAVMLLALAAVPVVLEGAVLRRGRYARTGNGVARRAAVHRLGGFAVPAYAFAALVVGASVVMPAAVLGYWMILSPPLESFIDVISTFGASFLAAFPAALLSVAAAVPLVYLAVRYPSPAARLSERVAYIGYAVPPLALALAFVFFSLRVVPALYQSLPLLVAAFALNFLALAMGPVRSALLQSPMRLEEAARSLGYGAFGAFMKAVAPLIGRGAAASLMLVFVMAMKELPISFLLAPTGFTTLSVAVFSRTSEAMMPQAAPYAAAIVLFSSLFVGLILKYEGRS